MALTESSCKLAAKPSVRDLAATTTAPSAVAMARSSELGENDRCLMRLRGPEMDDVNAPVLTSQMLIVPPNVAAASKDPSVDIAFEELISPSPANVPTI